MYLLDTNLISALAPTRARQLPEFAAWLERHSDQVFLSVVTIAEVEDGIAKARRDGAGAKALRLTEWLESLLHLYGPRVLPLDVATARVAGRLSDLARGRGHAPGFADLAIAATAENRTFIVLTRNVRHFRMLDVQVCDPFVALP